MIRGTPSKGTRKLALFCASVLCLGSAQTHGALLSGTVNTAPSTSANLTTFGTVDWAMWANTATAATTTGPVRFSKSGGTAAFSALTSATTGNVRGGNTTTTAFTFTDGTSPNTTMTNDTTRGLIFDTDLDVVGEGVRFTVNGDTSTQRELRIWASGFDGQGTLTASLNGATDVALVSQTYNTTNPKAPTLFVITYQPDNNSDLLNIKYVLSTNGSNTNSHVGIQAAAVMNVPEPGSAMLFAAGGLLLAARRKRINR